MQKRINFEQALPQGFKEMLRFAQSSKPNELSALQTELIKIRASQINGCAYCLDLHVKAAKQLGEKDQRIYLLAAWKETTVFTPEEKAILLLTDEITCITNNVKDETYEQAAKVLTEIQIAEVILTAVVINSWNRIAKATLWQPPVAS